MSQHDSKLLPPLTRAISDCLDECGASRREVSLATNHGEGWLSEMLNPKRTPPLTIPAIEQVARFTGRDPVELIWRAFPHPATSDRPYDLLHAYSPKEQDGEIAPRVAAQLESLLERNPNVTTIDAEIDVELVEWVADSVWRDRPTAYQVAFFNVANLFSKPRKVHTLIVCLALLSEILRTLRTSDTYYRARLLQRAYELAGRYPHPAVEVYIDERVAYYLWNISSDPAIASRIVERPKMMCHPMLHRLLTARAMFQHLLGFHDIALGHLELARVVPDTDPVFQSLVQNMIGSASMHSGRYDKAEDALEKSMAANGLPEDVLCNNLAVKAKCALLQGEYAAAIPILTKILQSPFGIRWPDKAAYMALDLFEASERENLQLEGEVINHLLALQERLLPRHPVEGRLRRALQQGIAVASSTITTALQRRLGDPNG